MSDLQELHRFNTAWRRWMDEHTKFSTPDTLDCLRYMLIECGEVLDLWMRNRNPEHARNNARSSTIQQELADVAMLVLTALPNGDSLPSVRTSNYVFDADTLCFCAGYIVKNVKEGRPIWTLEQACLDILLFILAYPGLGLPAELHKCHRRLARKHGLPHLGAWWRTQGIDPFDHNIDLDAMPMPWLAEVEHG